MGKDIAIVYYRTGYSDKQYHNAEGAWCEKKWQARQMLESSSAVKCPSIHGQLTTFKKFQQAFSNEDYLAKYIPEQEHMDSIKQLFKNMVDLKERHDPKVE